MGKQGYRWVQRPRLAPVISLTMANSRKGPGRVSQSGRNEGRVTRPAKHQGAATGKYLSAEDRGRYTAPTPKSVHHSPAWYGPMILALFVLGVLVLALNYLNALPGAVSAWYLLVGLVLIFTGFMGLLRYR
jgi:hypothetical protein